MTNDLLHLIRDAEKKAEKIINDANLEAQKIIEEARSEAKQLLAEARAAKSDTQTDQINKIQKKLQTDIKEIEIQVKNQKEELKARASKNMAEAIDFVTRSILEE
ncbi:MAG: hypothetical protein ACFFB2_10365 [Promethearchaeota archaeon]